MRKIGVLLTIVGLLMCIQPSKSEATDFNFRVNAGNRDNTVYGELWYNDRPIWRVIVLADGAKPVLAGNDSVATLIVPDIVNGWFVFKVQ